MNKIEKIFFILIIIFGFTLRFWQLDKYPVSLNWDEVSHGYTAYSLINTGMDQWGAKWPIFNFRAYGDYPTTLNVYLTIPFVYFFGLSEITTRLPSAILGFGLIVISFYFGKIFFKENKYALILMFLVAVSPWTFFPSRAVFQSTVAQFFLFLGIYFLILSIKKSYKYTLPALLLISTSAFAYHNSRIIAPLLLLSFLIIFFKEILNTFKKHTLYSIITISIFLLTFIPQLLNLSNEDSRARSKWVFIINQNSINILEEKRNNFKGNQLVAKILYNKPLFFSKEVLNNYVAFLNPKILFFNSTNNYQFNIPKNGVMYPITMPFFFIGLILFFKEIIKKNKIYIFILFWYLIGLIPAVITYGDFPIIRAMTILPIPFLVTAFGYKFFDQHIIKNNKYLILILFFVIFLESFLYFKNYFIDYSKKYSSSWQYGYKESVQYIKDHYNEYEDIYITKKYGEAHEFLLFYWPWDPVSYQNDKKLIWDKHADWYWVDGFDKFHFINDWEVKDITKNIDKKTLLITSPNNYNTNSKLLKSINFLNNEKAFDIIEIQ